MLLSPGLQEEVFVPAVHPFWVLVSIVNFLLLLYFMRRLLWGPIMTMLTTRAEKIREGLAMAEQAKAEREQLKAEIERRLTEVQREAQAIGERLTKAAEAAAGELRMDAKKEADSIRERGREDAKQLHDQALAQLRSELAGMVVLAASRVLGREVDAEQHRALIERSLDEAAAQLTEQS